VKPSGRKTVRINLKARMLPVFGPMPLHRVGPEDVAEWFNSASSDKPGAANRVQDPAFHDVPGRGLGLSGAWNQSQSQHQIL